MSKHKIARRAFLFFSYALSLFMLFAGVATALGPVDTSSNYGWLYDSREVLVTYGILFVGSGLALLYGLLKRRRKWVGRGLMAIYLCFVFAASLNAIALGIGELAAWVPNIIVSLLVAVLYLQWRFKTEYIDPEYFQPEIESLTSEEESYERN